MPLGLRAEGELGGNQFCSHPGRIFCLASRASPAHFLRAAELGAKRQKDKGDSDQEYLQGQKAA